MSKTMKELIDDHYYWEDQMTSEPDYWDEDGEDYDYDEESEDDSETWVKIGEKRAQRGCTLDGRKAYPGSYQEVEKTEKNTKTGEIRKTNYLDGA